MLNRNEIWICDQCKKEEEYPIPDSFCGNINNLDFMGMPVVNGWFIVIWRDASQQGYYPMRFCCLDCMIKYNYEENKPGEEELKEVAKQIQVGNHISPETKANDNYFQKEKEKEL